MAREGFSRGDLLLFVAVLAVAGAAVSAYLTYEWYAAFGSSVCDLNNYFSCSVVGQSAYASIAGIPTSTVGLAGFLILLGLAVGAFRGRERIGPWSVDRWLLVFAGLGALVGLGLTLIEMFVIRAICIFCALGFAIDLGILYLAWRLGRAPLAAGA